MDPISYNFQVTVDPCVIDGYAAYNEPKLLSYVIGDPAVNGGNYYFAEACNYPGTITLSRLPIFVVHNEATRDFTITSTDDLRLEGSYSIEITSTIS